MISTTAFGQTAPNDPRVNRGGSDDISSNSIPNLPKGQSNDTIGCANSAMQFDEKVMAGSTAASSFLIGGFKLVDANGSPIDSRSVDKVNDRLSGYIGQTTDVTGLQAIAVQAQCILRSNGNLLSAVRVPPQKFSRTGGEIELRVILGFISNIDYIYNGERLPENLSLTSLSSSEKRAISRVRTQMNALMGDSYDDDASLERSVLLASKIPGIAVRPTLKKADNGNEGAVALTVDIFEFDKFAGDLTVLNYSPSSLGEWGPLLQMASHSQLTGGDELLVSAYSSFDFKSQRVVRGTYSAPIGKSDWRWSVFGSYGESSPGDDLTNIELETKSVIYGAELKYPWVVRANLQAGLYAGVEHVDQNLSVLDVEITDDKLSVGYAGIEGYYALPWMVSTYGAEVRQGLNVLGASDKGDTNISRIGANPQATIVRANLENRVPLGNVVEFRSRFTGQYASDSLLGYEEYSVGNYTTGRGYEPGQLSGDSAVAGSFELGVGSFELGGDKSSIGRVNVKPFAFYDAAKIWNKDQFSENRFVHSYGAGVKLDIGNRISADITYAQADRKVFSFSEEAPGGSVLVRTSLKF